MRRRVLLVALAACEASPPPPEPPPPRWLYPPAPVAPPIPAPRGRLGRGQPPQLPLAAGITAEISGELRVPLRLATPWPVPGDGPARAVVYGLEGARPAVELIDVDAGRVVWRDTASCAGPIVGVSEAVVVCADAAGVRAIGLDGKPRWQRAATYLASSDDRVVIAGEGEAIVLDAADGDELTRLRLPPSIALESIVASCGDTGRELFAIERGGKLVRLADGRGGLTIVWTAPAGGGLALDPCRGDAVVVAGTGPAGAALIAFARTTGAVTGRVDGVRGHWGARDGDGIEVATALGVAGYPPDLSGPPRGLALPALGELIAERRDRRLVRATPLTAVLLDRSGVRAHLAFAAMGAVLGDAAIVTASWQGSPGETVHRIGVPARLRRALRLAVPARGVAVPAELRDAPPVRPVELAAAVALPDTARHGVADIALDPGDPHRLYAAVLEREPEPTSSAGVAGFDLAARAWRWQRGDGCGPGTPIALTVAAEVVACGARGVTATVRATSRDGARRWEWEGDNLDAMTAAGGVVLVHDADRLHVLDAATGRATGRLASDDGAPVRAAAVVVDRTTWLISYEHGRLVARLPGAGLVAAWSLAVDGVVRALAPSGDGVLVELEGGDAFRVDLRSGELVAIAGLGLTWSARGELITGATLGGPIPAPPPPPPPLPPRPRPPWLYRYVRAAPPSAELAPPPLWKPIPAPPPLGDSWQYTLYELTGAVRARNDYAITGPIQPSPERGPPGSPLVVAHGPGLLDVLVIDARTGDPVQRVALPVDAPPGLTFATVVGGSPVAGAVLAAPLRVVVF